MKPSNILYKKINENTVFHYRINDNDYYVPTYGYLFMICDYGTSKFKLDGRKMDIINLNYSIVKTYITNLDSKYCNGMNKSNINTMKTIKSSEEILNGKMDKDIVLLINELLKIENIEMNKYIFEIYQILTSEKNIIDILNSKYNDFTNKKRVGIDIVSFILKF
jgi:hypothetical protein